MSKVDKAGQITVAFPGVAGKESSKLELIVFSDTSGQVWAREVWNKKGAKRAALRKGWAFSPGAGGQWLVRGQVVGTAHTLLAHMLLFKKTIARRDVIFLIFSIPAFLLMVFFFLCGVWTLRLVGGYLGGFRGRGQHVRGARS